MGFKNFLEDHIDVVAPKPNKIKFRVNLREYDELVHLSHLKEERKQLIAHINEKKGEIPVFCEELKKFYMINLSDKKYKARELKSRDDKSLSGALYNGMLEKHYRDINKNAMTELLETKLSWEAPNVIYKVKDEFGKDIYLKKS